MWGTECLNTRSPMPNPLYTGYSVKVFKLSFLAYDNIAVLDSRNYYDTIDISTGNYVVGYE